MKTSKLSRYFLSILCTASLLFSCSDDDTSGTIANDPFVAAFEGLSANLGTINNNEAINIVYSQSTSQPGSMTIALETTNAIYGEDFTTQPVVIDNKITIPINQSENGTSFTFNKINETLDETVEIKFTIIAIDYPNATIQGNTAFVLNSSASLGRTIAPQVGGPNQPNQVYIDLSTEQIKQTRRDTWDVSFYGGSNYRVGINGSIYMAAAELESNNIDNVTSTDVEAIQDQIAVGTFDPANENYIDHPDGDINKTAISEISANPSDNKVYLVNLGFEVGTENPEPGSVAVAGDARGWKKIRVLRENDGYLLQYANLDDTTHNEVSIPKNSVYNFTFFSFNTNSALLVEPEAENWDICFTVFTNLIDGAGSYGFSDGVLHNRKGSVTAYEVTTDEISYNDFSITNVDNSRFQLDQRVIGSNWRDVFEGTALDDRFYIIQDPNGNNYKLKFLGMLNDSGERGFPEFDYKLLQ